MSGTYAGGRSGRRLRRKLIGAAAVCAGIWLLASVWARMTPIVRALAAAEATNAASAAVNGVISEMLSEGSMDYSRLVRLEKDASGKISALTADMARINLLKAEVTRRVIESAAHTSPVEVSVPLGNLFGGSLLSGRGPRIPVSVLSVSGVETDFINHFDSAGINQTRHRIVAAVTMDMKILTPGGSVMTRAVTHVTVAETVIVGDVPESYTYFEGDERWDENAERYDITT
ncbi:MAG: sporulation protein YunB [Oscillospiraceae bacterium]|nr:sporulation protein YunB [Oscillospiraceae bacterium]